MLTVGDLKRIIGGLPDHLEVIVSKDAEGNSYSPMEGVYKGIYEPETKWSGDFIGDEEDPEAIAIFPVQ
jgi:hypothetical protein